MNDGNLDAALDAMALSISFALMGPDEQRRLKLALADQIDPRQWQGRSLKSLRDLDALAGGQRPPATLHDRLTLERLDRERARAPFDEDFWERRRADLCRAGWPRDDAAAIVEATRERVEGPSVEWRKAA